VTFQQDYRSFVLAAGGTGGHMFPAEALARELIARGEKVVLVTDRRGQAFGRDLEAVDVWRVAAPMMGAGLAGKARTALGLVRAYGQARGILRSLNPAAVVGFGGYATAPTVFAARRLGLPVVIHEQNAFAGKVNRFLARGASAVALGFPTSAGLSPAVAGRAVHTGNPVRQAIADLRERSYDAPEADGRLNLLILGGSQGARVFSEVVPAAVEALPAELRGRLAIVQQCRKEDLDGVRATYERLGVEHTLSAFFTDVPERLAECHLAITRAGASTVAELAAAGRPEILVPYPHAADDHQTANARVLAEAGGALLQPQAEMTAPALARKLESLLGDPAGLARMAEATRGFGVVDAARRLADLVQRIGGRNGNGNGQGKGGHADSFKEAAE